jgi:hypothetical protein
MVIYLQCRGRPEINELGLKRRLQRAARMTRWYGIYVIGSA